MLSETRHLLALASPDPLAPLTPEERFEWRDRRDAVLARLDTLTAPRRAPRLDLLVGSLLPGECGCGEVDQRRLVDEAVDAALLDAADFFMRRDGATYVVDELLRMRHEWERSHD